jgi:hypothetical protein
MSIPARFSPDSWGIWFASDPRQIEWPQFLDELAEAGYEWMELGLYGYRRTSALARSLASSSGWMVMLIDGVSTGFCF